MTLDVDKAIPCGLIVNELVSNALKYAFPPDAKVSADFAGQVHVALRPIAEGDYTVYLAIFDATYTNGLVWGTFTCKVIDVPHST